MTPVSPEIHQMLAEMRAMRKNLPPEQQKALDSFEANLPTFIHVITGDDTHNGWRPMPSVLGMQSSSALVEQHPNDGRTQYRNDKGRYTEDPRTTVRNGGGKAEHFEANVNYPVDSVDYSKHTDMLQLTNDFADSGVLNAGARLYVHGEAGYLMMSQEQLKLAANADGMVGINLVSIEQIGSLGRVRGDVDMLSLTGGLGGYILNDGNRYGVGGHVGAMAKVITGKVVFETEKMCAWEVACGSIKVQAEAGLGVGAEIGGEARVETGAIKKGKLRLNAAFANGPMTAIVIDFDIESKNIDKK